MVSARLLFLGALLAVSAASALQGDGELAETQPLEAGHGPLMRALLPPQVTDEEVRSKRSPTFLKKYFGHGGGGGCSTCGGGYGGYQPQTYVQPVKVVVVPVYTKGYGGGGGCGHGGCGNQGYHQPQSYGGGCSTCGGGGGGSWSQASAQASSGSWGKK